MTTYLASGSSLANEVVPEATRHYYRRHLHRAVYEFLIETFRRLEDTGQLTRAKLSVRIGRDAASITRWLSEPGNLELNTISDLLVGMGVDPTTILVDYLPLNSTRRRHP